MRNNSQKAARWTLQSRQVRGDRRSPWFEWRAQSLYASKWHMLHHIPDKERVLLLRNSKDWFRIKFSKVAAWSRPLSVPHHQIMVAFLVDDKQGMSCDSVERCQGRCHTSGDVLHSWHCRRLGTEKKNTCRPLIMRALARRHRQQDRILIITAMLWCMTRLDNSTDSTC
jgi:hypothetical protein